MLQKNMRPLVFSVTLRDEHILPCNLRNLRAHLPCLDLTLAIRGIPSGNSHKISHFSTPSYVPTCNMLEE